MSAEPVLADTAALDSGQHTLHHAALSAEVEALAAQLRKQQTRVLATLMDNGPAWVVADLAAARAAVVHVPLPVFFTAAQVQHALRAAGVDTVLTTPAFAAQWSAPTTPAVVATQTLAWVRLTAAPVALPAGTAKITFTSGTTGAPKGVCLGATGMAQVADSLVQAMAPLDIQRHLCALPFAVLLENLAGVLAPLRRGATLITLPLQQLGLVGSCSFDAVVFNATVAQHRPHSVILLPQMLRAWVGTLQHSGQRAPAGLKFVAVGGAAVGAELLHAARAVGIPAYEGYGLSEGASVQTLNLPGADLPGSAGKALPHASVRVAADGELLVSGPLFLGYLGDTTPPPAWWPTGDLGRIDSQGFVHVHGRKKNVLITAFGRNVSPEWVETGLRSHPAVAQAVVLGDGEPALSAVLWPMAASMSDAALQQAVDRANAPLPDYARVHRWVRAQAPFTAESGLATANGRPQRAQVAQRHATALGLATPQGVAAPSTPVATPF